MMNAEDLEKAACAGKDVNLFFPEGPYNAIENSVRYAKSICATCPVKDACLKAALENNMTGIWGGTTDQERRALRWNARRTVR